MRVLQERRILLFQISIILVLYAAGTYVRLAPLSNWGVYVTADDPVLHVRVTEYVLEHGHMPRNDTLAWYPWGQNWERVLPNFRYYLTAGLYALGRSLGFGMSLYDFCVFFPAFFAPLAVVPMFLLVKELRGWKSGLVAAGVLVLSSGYLTRTIAGFYRHEHVGLPLLIFSMYFFVKAMKSQTVRKSIGYAVLSGVALTLLTGTWSGFRFLLDGYAVVTFLAMLTRRMDERLLSTFVIVDGMALASTFFWPRLNHYFYASSEFAVALLVIITAIVYWYILREWLDPERLPMATLGLSFILFLVMLGTISSLPEERLEIVVNPLREAEPGDVSQTVAEHASMRLQFRNGRLDWPALNSYGVFLFLVPIGIVLPFLHRGGYGDSNRNLLAFLIFVSFLLFMALDPYAALVTYVVLWVCVIALWYLTPEDARPANEEMMMIIFALLSAYFFKNMIRLNILFAAYVATMSGISFGYGLEMISEMRDEASKKRAAESRMKKRREKRRKRRKRAVEPEPEVKKAPFDYSEAVLAGLVGALLVWGLSSSYSSASGYPLGLRDDWFQALDWIEKNSEPEDVIMSWWDYGYWIQTYADRPTIADGATNNWSQIQRLAKAFVTTETEAMEFCTEFDVRYIMVDVSDDFVGGKWTAMAVIAEQNVQDYIGSQDGQPVVLEKGSQALLFKLSSREAMSQALPLDPRFEYRETFVGDRGGRVIVYEYVPSPA